MQKRKIFFQWLNAWVSAFVFVGVFVFFVSHDKEDGYAWIALIWMFPIVMLLAIVPALVYVLIERQMGKNSKLFWLFLFLPYLFYVVLCVVAGGYSNGANVFVDLLSKLSF